MRILGSSRLDGCDSVLATTPSNYAVTGLPSCPDQVEFENIIKSDDEDDLDVSEAYAKEPSIAWEDLLSTPRMKLWVFARRFSAEQVVGRLPGLRVASWPIWV
jgi:hypothetical protein